MKNLIYAALIVVAGFVVGCGQQDSTGSRFLSQEELKQLNDARHVEFTKNALEKMNGAEFNKINAEMNDKEIESVSLIIEKKEDSYEYRFKLKMKEQDEVTAHNRIEIIPESNALANLTLVGLGEVGIYGPPLPADADTTEHKPECLELWFSKDSKAFAENQPRPFPLFVCK